jgi:hypothetical protein
MDKQIRKRAPLTKQIQRLFVPAKVTYMHKLYPVDYYRPVWFNQLDFNGIAVVARMEQISKKAAAHLLFEAGFKYYMGVKVKEHIKAQETAEAAREQAVRTRFILELRRLCREKGWDINKLL